MTRAALAILLAVVTAAARPAEVTNDGNHLLEQCKVAIENEMVARHTMEVGICMGYLWGFRDAMTIRDATVALTAGKTGKSAVERTYCPPANGISNTQAARIVVNYLERNPQLLHLHRGLVTMAALSNAYPCN